MAIYFKDDLVLFVDGLVAGSSDCCCGGGACCIDGECSITTEAGCSGNYLGDGSTCDGVDCTMGACCFDPFCEIDTESDCFDSGGVYQGDGSTCTPLNPCAPSGACCHPGGGCSITNADGCDGFYAGDDTVCADADCAHTGACCDHGTCTTSSEEDCAGVYQGDGSSCDPNPCSQPCCDGGSFYNPADATYYQTTVLEVTASFSNTDTSETASYTSTKTENCTEGCTPEGTGTYHRTSDGCDCTETFICGGPAAGFWGISGMTFTESCAPTACRSALIQLCDFGDCTSSSILTYQDPCPPPESPFSPFDEPFFQNN